ncbi:MAG: hypothetical protein LBU24_01215 [Methanocalculaceae archaeon]|jgi:tryptophan synthase beta chain|nr:hypothetical protein [Methanocalculaceae archaeon]
MISPSFLYELDIVPDVMVGYIGGGSNFAGFTFLMIENKLRRNVDTGLPFVELVDVPSLTKGEYRYDFGAMPVASPRK